MAVMCPLKIAHFAHAPVVGGTLRQMARLCTNLDPAKFTSFVICSTASAVDEYAEELRQASTPVVRLTVSGKFDWRNLVRLWRFLRRQACDIMHVQLAEPFDSTPVFLAARLAGIPVVLASERLMYDHPHVNKRWYSPIIKIWQTRDLVDRTIAVSEAAKDSLLQALPIAPERVTVIHDLLALEPPSLSEAEIKRLREELGIPPQASVIGFVGHLIPAKGIALFLEAVRQLAQRYPSTHYLVIGQGPWFEQTLTFVKTHNLTGRVSVLGYQRQIGRWFQMMDIFVAPSYSESFGDTLVEAMALGVPVVTTNVGIAPEIITHQHTGLIIPTDDAPAIGQAVAFLLDNPDQARLFGSRGKSLVQGQFRTDRIMAQFETLYQHEFSRKHPESSNCDANT